MDPPSISTGQAPQDSTVSLKGPEISPPSEIAFITDADFTRYQDTGIRAVLNLPLAKTSKNAILAINMDGFVPGFNITDNAFAWARIVSNLFPVQELAGGPNLKITWENTARPVDMLYASHRGFSGSIGLGIRISSNTAQTGNLMITHATGIQRFYYNGTTNNIGLTSANTTLDPIDFAVKGFTLFDLSINRQVSIVANRKDNMKFTDLAQKLAFVGVDGLNAVTENIRLSASIFASQFLEDWVLITPLSDLPSSGTNQLTFSFYFDYSRIQWYEPMWPVIPVTNIIPTQEILDYSATFEGHSWNGITKSTATWIS